MIVAALGEYVAKHEDDAITARLDRLYATEPSGLDPDLRRVQRESVGAEDFLRPTAYRIDVEEQDLVVRMRRDVLDREDISRFLDYLELASLRRRSALTEEDAARLADEVDRGAWNRHRRLAEACALLDPVEERALAEGMGEYDPG